jgi:adenosylcobinamide-phosphate synthase
MSPPFWLALPLGFLLDQLLGDPSHWPHPVRWIGRLIQLLEKLLRRGFPERLGGILLLLTTAGITGVVVWGSLELAELWHPWARFGLTVILFYFGIAARSLAREAQGVLQPCARADWVVARQRLSRIVGRDTQDLTPEEIYRACIETIAENTTDGVVAPLFYAALLGPIGMWLYKAINTLDSMVGYRNERYRRFGWASARADDAVNYVPARLTWLLLALAALLTGGQGGRAFVIGWRDSRKHPSPNSAWSEAAMAGALAIQLGGSSRYEGVLSQKPYLGEPLQPLTVEKVHQAIGVMLVTAWLAVALAATVRAFLTWSVGVPALAG